MKKKTNCKYCKDSKKIYKKIITFGDPGYLYQESDCPFCSDSTKSDVLEIRTKSDSRRTEVKDGNS
jgi:hypothetical protein